MRRRAFLQTVAGLLGLGAAAKAAELTCPPARYPSAGSVFVPDDSAAGKMVVFFLDGAGEVRYKAAERIEPGEFVNFDPSGRVVLART